MEDPNINNQTAGQSQLAELLADKTYLNIPKVSDVIKGEVIDVSRNEVRVDVPGYRTGVVRGRELTDPSLQFEDVQKGDIVEATVIDLENENGEVELSFRFAGQRKAWDNLHELMRTGEAIPVKVLEASKGGLIVKAFHVTAFLPVSQLSPENYPRVAGGDKSKILEKLKSFVGTTMDVRVIDANEKEEKVIVSEKAIWEERQKNVISKYRIGDLITGEVSALADFGAFVKFDILEGLVHISEIAWQRIDHPRDLLKVGEEVKAEIIGIEGSKIFLSMKKLVEDPWSNVGERYKVGQKVKGTILKSNPFGFFVELDENIHGLAHISELSSKPVKDLSEIAKPGEEVEFMIVSVEPDQHRLGLSLKAMEKGAEPVGEKAEEKVEEKAEETVPAEAGTEEPKADETVPAEAGTEEAAESKGEESKDEEKAA
jgi:small subunit ribosomal protein S1